MRSLEQARADARHDLEGPRTIISAATAFLQAGEELTQSERQTLENMRRRNVPVAIERLARVYRTF